MKMLHRQVARLVLNKRGFSTIELALTCTLIMLAAAIVLPNIVSFRQNIENLRAKNMAYMLVSDLRRVQTMDMYRGRDFYAMNFDGVQNIYYVSQNTKMIEKKAIADFLSSDWSIKAVNKQNVFYMRGTVNAYNYIDVFAGNVAYRVQILPVTGRIGVYKK